MKPGSWSLLHVWIFSARALRLLGSALIASGLAGSAWAAQSPQLPLAGSAIPQFVQPLPTLNLGCVNADCAMPGGLNTVLGNKSLTLKMCEFEAAVLPVGAPLALGAPRGPNGQPLTWTWGYLVDPAPTGDTPCATLANLYRDPLSGAVDTYLGPVVVSARGGGSTDITWVNELGGAATTNVLAYKYSTDQTLHWADPDAAQVDGSSNLCMMLAEMSAFPGGLSYPPFGHWCAQNYAGPVPAVPHLHGGEVPPEIDGSPDSWWTSDGSNRGHKFYTYGAPASNAAIYRYPNTQEAAPIWFHDHTLGATRLNVYAGLAGAYYVYDPARISVTAGGACTTDCLPVNLHPLTEVVPLVLQDRMFDTNGQLFFTADTAGGILWALNPEHPYWNPEFVGDAIAINGKVWPFHDVARKRYRFLLINGSNARTYELFLTDPVTKVNGPSMWVIATDGGYLDSPVKIDPNAPKAPKGAPPNLTRLVIQPGERYEVIIDFGDPAWLALNPLFSGSLVLKNTGATPFPKGPPPQGTTLGQMMKFVVSPAPVADASYNPATDGPLRSGANRIHRLVDTVTGALAPGVTVPAAKTRVLTLNEVMGMPMTVSDPVTGVLTPFPGGPLEVLVNNTKWGGMSHGVMRSDFTYSTVNGTTTGFSELPVEGDTEVWEIVNLTADAHPIHLHAVQFQLLNRQAFNTAKYPAAYAAAFPGGVFLPGYGPPKDYRPALNPLSAGKLGGNPDITPFLQGPVQPPLPSEAGWKDTVINYPGMVTRYAVRWAPNSLPIGSPAAQLAFPFDPSGGAAAPGETGLFNYVWHCHIIDHEDNEMMRPSFLTLNPSADPPAARELVRGAAY